MCHNTYYEAQLVQRTNSVGTAGPEKIHEERARGSGDKNLLCPFYWGQKSSVLRRHIAANAHLAFLQLMFSGETPFPPFLSRVHVVCLETQTSHRWFGMILQARLYHVSAGRDHNTKSASDRMASPLSPKNRTFSQALFAKVGWPGYNCYSSYLPHA